MTRLAYTPTELSTDGHVPETQIRQAILTGELPASVVAGRLIITAAAAANYIASLPRFQPVRPEDVAAKVRQDAAARARGRAIAGKALALGAVEPSKARGRKIAEHLLGKARK